MRHLARQYLLDVPLSRTFRLMHDPPAPEMLGELRVVGDVVATREVHQPDATDRLDLFHARRGKPWRVHKDIPPAARGSDDKIRPRAKTRFRREATKEKVAGAIWRHASQSMQLESTKKSPSTFSCSRRAVSAIETPTRSEPCVIRTILNAIDRSTRRADW